MPIYKGSTKLGIIYHGSTKIGKVYRGSTLVYQTAQKFTMYRMASTSNTNWTVGFAMGKDGSPLTSNSDDAYGSSSDDNCNQLSRLVAWGANKATVQVYCSYNSYTNQRNVVSANYIGTNIYNGFTLRCYRYNKDSSHYMYYISENQVVGDTILHEFYHYNDATFDPKITESWTNCVAKSGTLDWIYRP